LLKLSIRPETINPKINQIKYSLNTSSNIKKIDLLGKFVRKMAIKEENLG